MEYIIVQPVSKIQSEILIDFLNKNKIVYEDKESTLQPPENPNIGLTEFAGAWKDEKITLASIRKKAWRKIKL